MATVPSGSMWTPSVRRFDQKKTKVFPARFNFCLFHTQVKNTRASLRKWFVNNIVMQAATTMYKTNSLFFMDGAAAQEGAEKTWTDARDQHIRGPFFVFQVQAVEHEIPV